VRRPVLLALAALAVLLPANAHAAVPCRDRIYNQWYSTGKISTSYPLSCYADALKHVPSDALVYSNLSSDIKAALLAAKARQNDPSAAPSEVGSGPGTPPVHQTKGAATAKTGGALASSAAGSPVGLPMPILVLGAVALAIAAAGAAGTGWRYLQRRR
jgi:hypothetical protein